MPEFKGLVKRFGALPNDSNIYWIPFKQHSNLGRSESWTPLTHLSHSVYPVTSSMYLKSSYLVVFVIYRKAYTIFDDQIIGFIFLINTF